MPRPSSWNHGHAFLVVVYAISARIASTSSPLASAIQRNSRSVKTPGGRGPVPSPFGAGAGCSFSRGGAIAAMRGSGLYARWGSRAGARDGWGVPVPCTTRPTSRRRDGDLADLRLGLLEQRLRQRRVVDRAGQLLAVACRCSCRNALSAAPLLASVWFSYTMIHVGEVIGYAARTRRVDRVEGEVGVDRRTLRSCRRPRARFGLMNLPARVLDRGERQAAGVGVGEVDVADRTVGASSPAWRHPLFPLRALRARRPLHGRAAARASSRWAPPWSGSW